MKKIVLIFLIILAPTPSTSQEFGQNEHPMNKDTDNMAVLDYWDTNVSRSDKKLYRTALKSLSKSKSADYENLIANKEYLKRTKKNPKHLLGGPMLGNIKANSVNVWLRTSLPSKVQLVLNANEGGFMTEAIYTLPENDLTGIFSLSDLSAETSYSYSIIINDILHIKNEKFHFKTLPDISTPQITRIAFGSCLHRWGLGNKRLFKSIKKRNPSAFLALGDIAVQDRNNHISMHRADYLLRDFQSAWSDFSTNTPIYASWDDHDYFDNDKSGIPSDYTDKDRKNVRAIFKNSWCNPAYGSDDEGIYFKTTIGLADIIMTDNRYFRSEKENSFLGKRQMSWLKEQIKNCKSPFLVLSCGTMWSDYVSNGKDSWGTLDPKGREEIYDLIEKGNLSGVVLISGDRHGARGFTIQRESGYELFEFEVASLGARIGPPKTRPDWSTQLFGIDGTFAFGELTFSNTSQTSSAIFRLIDESGEIYYKKKLPLDALIKVSK